ncbi:MAG: FAD-binding oxidoreductase [Pseudomonadota bacterium]
MSTAEITVLGGGIFGLATAWSCLKRGARVRVQDTRKIGDGASGGLVGALAPHTPDNWNEKKQFQFESLVMAEPYWAEIAELSGIPSSYARHGRVQPIASARAKALADDRAIKANSVWAGFAQWDVVPAQGAWMPQTDTGFVIHDTLSARLHPRQAVTALATAFQRRGGELLEGSTTEPQGLVVHATGYEGLSSLSQTMRHPVGNGVKGQALLLRHDARHAPQLFADGLHIVPHHDGTVAVGSTSERDWTDAYATDAQLDDIHTRALAAFPVLQGAQILERWAGVRPRAVSRAPIMDHYPDRPGHFVANGGFKIGFGIAPKLGEVMADLILEGTANIPESFRLRSFLP